MYEVKKVNVQEYRASNGWILTAYTAEWCGPCRRIKPTLLNLVKDLQNTKNSELLKDEYKEKIHPFVPYFLVTSEDGTVIQGIQTSDEILLTDFVDKFIMGDFSLKLDDDF